MYKIDFRLHTNLEVISMYISINVETDFKIKSLEDLPKLKQLMEHLKMKINKSQLARDLDVDRRTIDKYLNDLFLNVHERSLPKLMNTMKSSLHYFRKMLSKSFIIVVCYGSI